jgi:hypothetical protein
MSIRLLPLSAVPLPRLALGQAQLDQPLWAAHFGGPLLLARVSPDFLGTDLRPGVQLDCWPPALATDPATPARLAEIAAAYLSWEATTRPQGQGLCPAIRPGEPPRHTVSFGLVTPPERLALGALDGTAAPDQPGAWAGVLAPLHEPPCLLGLPGPPAAEEVATWTPAGPQAIPLDSLRQTWSRFLRGE